MCKVIATIIAINTREITMDFIWETPSEVASNLAKRIKKIRKRKKITQVQLSQKCNVSYGALKKFEQTGEISLISLIKIAMELNVDGEIKDLFTDPVYMSIDEVINDAN